MHQVLTYDWNKSKVESLFVFLGCEGQVEHSVWEECQGTGGNCNQCIQENGFCSDCKVGQQDYPGKFSSKSEIMA